VFLQLEGTRNENIKIDGGDMSKAAAVLAYKNGVTKRQYNYAIEPSLRNTQ
jgi:hypothetical protein